IQTETPTSNTAAAARQNLRVFRIQIAFSGPIYLVRGPEAIKTLLRWRVGIDPFAHRVGRGDAGTKLETTGQIGRRQYVIASPGRGRPHQFGRGSAQRYGETIFGSYDTNPFGFGAILPPIGSGYDGIERMQADPEVGTGH